MDGVGVGGDGWGVECVGYFNNLLGGWFAMPFGSKSAGTSMWRPPQKKKLTPPNRAEEMMLRYC